MCSCQLAIESALLTLATAKTKVADGPGPSTEVCRLYNNNKCQYKKCKYRHSCAVCNGPHPPSSSVVPEASALIRAESAVSARGHLTILTINWTGSALLFA